MIDQLTHYYRRGREPFQSLSALPDKEAIRKMQELYVEGSAMWERFKDPAQYLQIRRQIEQWLREEFIAKGGNPQESCPIYMVIGNPKWTAKVADMATLAVTAEMQIPLSIFNESDVSFTYPDSMVSWLLANEKNPAYYQPGYHGQVFNLSEIRSIIAQKGMPDEGWETNVPASLAHYIEAQVWNQEPLREYKRRISAENSDVPFIN
jgi:hypothetical protein